MKTSDLSSFDLIYKSLLQLEELCLSILDSVAIKHIEDHILLKMLAPSLWEIDLPCKQLTETEISEDSLLILEMNNDMINPTKEESDFCLGLVLKNCSLNEKCLDTEYRDDNTGYSLTHQVLFWRLFEKENCGRKNKLLTSENIIEHKCMRILQEIEANFQFSSFKINEDLLLEQVALCGMENYQEFLSRDFKDIILSLQSDSGCYELNQKYTNDFTKEELKLYNNHFSSVATLALTIQIKDLIKKTTQ